MRPTSAESPACVSKIGPTETLWLRSAWKRQFLALSRFFRYAINASSSVSATLPQLPIISRYFENRRFT